MKKYTQKQLKNLVATGAAIDVSRAKSTKDIPENYSQIGYVNGLSGCAGMLFKGDKSGKLYAITSRTQAIYIF